MNNPTAHQPWGSADMIDHSPQSHLIGCLTGRRFSSAPWLSAYPPQVFHRRSIYQAGDHACAQISGKRYWRKSFRVMDSDESQRLSYHCVFIEPLQRYRNEDRSLKRKPRGA